MVTNAAICELERSTNRQHTRTIRVRGQAMSASSPRLGSRSRPVHDRGRTAIPPQWRAGSSSGHEVSTESPQSCTGHIREMDILVDSRRTGVGKKLSAQRAISFPVGSHGVANVVSESVPHKSSLGPATVRKAVDELTPHRPRKFQSLSQQDLMVDQLRARRIAILRSASLAPKSDPKTSRGRAAFCVGTTSRTLPRGAPCCFVKERT